MHLKSNFLSVDPTLTSPTVFWAPKGAMQWRDSWLGKMNHRSAAVTLIHELGHAYHWDLDPKVFAMEGQEAFKDNKWDNAEEKRTILEIENRVADELRALGFNESDRYWHNPKAVRNFREYISIGSDSITESVSTVVN
jgi:hypothetical protein